MTVKKDYIPDINKLILYQKAKQFRKEIYDAVKQFPTFETYIMCDQLRRASSSVPSNIMEGHQNFYYLKEYDRLNTALGSIAECRSFLDMAMTERYITNQQYGNLDKKAEEILRMLIGKMRQIDKVVTVQEKVIG
ncbi:four helix bundle protein [Oceanobacillus picturae]|uniref:four helix bundle protein n=1 Tax=Oceanobacillus picturae TaxID=171693 RepID=UPI003636AD2A